MTFGGPGKRHRENTREWILPKVTARVLRRKHGSMKLIITPIAPSLKSDGVFDCGVNKFDDSRTPVGSSPRIKLHISVHPKARHVKKLTRRRKLLVIELVPGNIKLFETLDR